ncbi:MAG: restriction endonuclease subunit S [Sphingobacteriales bacterium]|jgi:type I restriction enzyme S subunit|nr:restriction endonuclease subunit S [Sphingobacteriales bacterium]
MKLRKDKWEKVKIKDCCQILDNLRKPISAIEREKRIEHKCQDELFPYYGATGLVGWIDDYLIDDEYVLIGEDGAPFFDKSKDIAYLISGKSWVNNHVHILKAKPEIADDKFILHYLNSFNDFGGYVNGTTRLKLNKGQLERIPIPLPPLSEQKQIAALFQSIETAMEQVDRQEKNLKALQKSLVNGLMSKEPVFGNLLNSKNCTPATFGEIAECDKKYPEHEKEVERFVGLEWIETDNFQLQGFGLVANGTTFTKRFAKGDVLFGKRRAYLKKVAIADFDGICSGDILVIRAKAKKMLQGLLPYYISADAFIQHAVSTSAGSLSPRTKWKDLADFEVSIPDLKTQEKILEVFQQLTDTINQLKQQKTTLKLLKQKLLNEILG